MDEPKHKRSSPAANPRNRGNPVILRDQPGRSRESRHPPGEKLRPSVGILASCGGVDRRQRYWRSSRRDARGEAGHCSLRLKRTTPSSFHVPPRPDPTSQITVGRPAGNLDALELSLLRKSQVIGYPETRTGTFRHPVPGSSRGGQRVQQSNPEFRTSPRRSGSRTPASAHPAKSGRVSTGRIPFQQENSR